MNWDIMLKTMEYNGERFLNIFVKFAILAMQLGLGV